MVPEEFLKILASILRASIRMMNEIRKWRASAQRHPKGFQYQVPLQSSTRTPPHHFAGIQIQDHRQIEPAFFGANISNIACPALVGGFRSKILFQPIGSDRQPMVTRCRSPKPSLGNALQARLAHQSGHPMMPTGMPLISEFGSDPKAPIGAHALCMNRANFSEEPAILTHSLTVWSLPPGIVPTGRDLEDLAHQPNRIGGTMTRYALKPRFDSLAKYAAASFKKSRSRFTRPNSRFKRTNSSSRATPLPRNA